jgi:hypothetical protein
LTAADVDASGAPEDDRTAVVAATVGRYPVRALRAGEALDAGSLSNGRIALAQYAIVRLALKQPPPIPPSPLPLAVELILAPRHEATAGAVIEGVELLGLADATTATLALPVDRRAELARLLGDADVYLVRRAP